MKYPGIIFPEGKENSDLWCSEKRKYVSNREVSKKIKNGTIFCFINGKWSKINGKIL